ncbi:MAG: hypothetical protein AAF346_04315 [Pseudomonadota bacterium]
MRAILAACGALIAFALMPGSAFGQTITLLGEEIANFKRDTDTFEIEINRDAYQGISIGVERGTIRLNSLTVTFRNGQSRDVEPDRVLKPGGPDYTLRFGSRQRRIAKIEATYRTLRRLSKKRAIVSVSGIIPISSRDGDDGEYRKSVTADLRDGRATIDVPRYSYPMRSLQIGVALRDVFVRSITVTFANGDVKRYNLNRWIDEGKRTPRLTFDRGARRVSQVVIATRPSQSRDIARFTLNAAFEDDASRRDERRPPNERKDAREDGNRFGPAPELDRGGAPRNHILLGTLDVVLGKPSLELTVNRGLGPITSLALRAGRRDVGIGTISAVYANGETDRIQVLRQLNGNSVSPKIALRRSGKLRSIRIKATALTTRPAKIRVYAMLDQESRQRSRRPAASNGEWIDLAFTRPPRFKSKTETVEVGRSKGRLEAFRIRVEKHDVRFKGIRVIFGNGSEQEFPFYDKVNDGVTTSKFVLARDGYGRFVQRIIVRYNTTANFKGSALVAFQGFRR